MSDKPIKIEHHGDSRIGAHVLILTCSCGKVVVDIDVTKSPDAKVEVQFNVGRLTCAWCGLTIYIAEKPPGMAS